MNNESVFLVARWFPNAADWTGTMDPMTVDSVFVEFSWCFVDPISLIQIFGYAGWLQICQQYCFVVMTCRNGKWCILVICVPLRNPVIRMQPIVSQPKLLWSGVLSKGRWIWNQKGNRNRRKGKAKKVSKSARQKLAFIIHLNLPG